jgi:hypothetical protein
VGRARPTTTLTTEVTAELDAEFFFVEPLGVDRRAVQ